MKYLAFVFYVGRDDYESGPNGGWFDFVGARNTLTEARECVEDKWEQGENYQIVDTYALKVVEEGEVYNTGAITFEERDRREKVLEQSAALRYIGPHHPEPPRERFIKYGNYTFDRESGKTVEEETQ